MNIKYCRKTHASYLRQSGIESESINMIQGRIGKDIFFRHYLTPDSSFKSKVLDAISKLQKEIQRD
jgi:intergrase/recombinase